MTRTNVPAKINAAQVWQAVAAGEDTATRVAATVGVSRSHAAIYLRVMTEVGLLDAHTEQIASQRGSALTYVYKVNYDAARALGW